MSATETFARLSGHQRIAGRLVHSSGSSAISVWDPATEERIGQIADANAADLDQAVAAEMLTREMGKPYKESFDEVA